jgi:5-formyltetrahydrofolate cyclo-ligase
MSEIDLRARKRLLRREFVERILGMDPDQRRGEEHALVERVADLPGFRGAKTVLLYMSAFPEEIGTGPVLQLAKSADKRLVFPRVDRVAQRLVLFEIVDPSSDLVPGTLGIPEPRPGLAEVAPAEVEWALIPGLGFDDRAFRLGRGRGHYDRLLTQIPSQTQRWAIALTPQGVTELPTEPHDQPVSGILFADRIVRAS